VLDNAIAHPQALHVLAADVEDELHPGQHLLGAREMGDRLYLAAVRTQRLQQQTLAVAGHGGVGDMDQRPALVVHGQRSVEIVEHGPRRADHIAAVVGIPAAQDLPLATDEGRLQGGAAGIDAQVDLTAIGGQVAAGRAVPLVALHERLVVVRGGEERGQTGYLAALRIAQVGQALLHLGQGDPIALPAGQRSAGGHEDVRVLRLDDVLRRERERLDEALLQLGQVLERATEEGHVAADGAPAGQAADGLRDDALEDGGGDVLLAGTLVEERLHVGLGEDAAPAGDGIDDGGALRQGVQAAGVGVEQGRHLVDERAGTAGAGAVHALLDAVVEVDDLGILATQLDGDVGLRDEGLHGGLARHDLLHEGQAEPL